MDRSQRILGDLLAPGPARPRAGAEIGPLHRALVPKSALPGGAVFYVDHCDTDALRAHWRDDPSVDPQRLHVDAVWGAHTLRQAIDHSALARQTGLVGRALDFVVASHVIEHVPDLLGWLQEIHEVLAPGGQLRLAVPDKRYCFDLLRRESSLAEVCEAHVCRRRLPGARQILDFALHSVQVDTAQAWAGAIDPASLPHHYTLAGALDLARDAEQNGHYHDVHCWTFTPGSLVALCGTLAEAGLLGFACDRLLPTARDELEFFVWMRKCEDAQAAAASWQRYLAPGPGLSLTPAH
jgi:SAM-dependent methyltransferase